MKPRTIRTFVEVAERAGADMLTSFSDLFLGNEPPDPSRPPARRVLFLGDALGVGPLLNLFGDGNFFVRRQTYLELGGSREEYGVGHEDHEFFARAVLNKARLYLVPESMFWYRSSADTIKGRHYVVASGRWRVMQPYLEDTSDAYKASFLVAQGLFTERLLRAAEARQPVAQKDEAEQRDLYELMSSMIRSRVGESRYTETTEALHSSAATFQLAQRLLRFELNTFLSVISFQGALARLLLRLRPWKTTHELDIG